MADGDESTNIPRDEIGRPLSKQPVQHGVTGPIDWEEEEPTGLPPTEEAVLRDGGRRVIIGATLPTQDILRGSPLNGVVDKKQIR